MAWLSTEFYFYPASAPCRAVWMTLHYLNIDYEEKVVDLLKAENKRPWFLRLNPLLKVPVLNDHSFYLWESRAIMMYLCNKFATEENQHLYPLEPEERGKVDRMLFFDMGTFYHAVSEYFGPKLYQGLPPDHEKENLLKQSLDYLDGFLETGGTGYFCGDHITLADIAILASLTEVEAMDFSYICYGYLTKWSEKIKAAMPFYKKCCEKGIQMTRERIKQLEKEHNKKEQDKETTTKKLCFKKN